VGGEAFVFGAALGGMRKEDGGRRRIEGRERKKEERRRKEEGGRRKEEGGRRKEEGLGISEQNKKIPGTILKRALSFALLCSCLSAKKETSAKK
jgi:hypothetical protein